MRIARGFSLIELLLATSLLAAGLAIAYATLRTAAGTASSAEAMIERTDRVRAVQSFLRRQFTGTLPLVLSRDERSGEVRVFEGEPDRVRFVAAMPGYLSRGGPYVQTLALVPDAGGYRLEFDHAMLLGEQVVEEAEPRPPSVLLENIVEARFAYRGLDERGELAEWVERWETPAQLPLMIRLDLRLADERMRWVPLEAALPLGFGRIAGPVVARPTRARGDRR